MKNDTTLLENIYQEFHTDIKVLKKKMFARFLDEAVKAGYNVLECYIYYVNGSINFNEYDHFLIEKNKEVYQIEFSEQNSEVYFNGISCESFDIFERNLKVHSKKFGRYDNDNIGSGFSSYMKYVYDDIDLKDTVYKNIKEFAINTPSIDLYKKSKYYDDSLEYHDFRRKNKIARFLQDE